MSRMENFQPEPPAAISRVLATFDRDQIEAFIEVAIGLLDLADGDIDLEDATDAEDEGLSPLAIAIASEAPGCPIADPDLEHDGTEPDDYF